jgi:sugar phosphate isomerase/epimerase
MWGLGHLNDPAAIPHVAKDLGFTALELNYSVRSEHLPLLTGGPLPVSSLHAPCPLPVDPVGRPLEGLHLASRDEERRSRAVQLGIATIRLAKSLGAVAVDFHMGEVGDPYGLEARLHRAIMDRALTETVDALREDVIADRASRAGWRLEKARASLKELAAVAAQEGIKIGLETRADFMSIPTLEEAEELLSEHDPSVVGYWHDTGHAHRLEVMGFYRHTQWLQRLGHRLVGCHVHDAVGLVDHMPPGRGQIDFEALAPYLIGVWPLVGEFSARWSAREIDRGRQFLARLGLGEGGS